jgi:hypothetical protein
MKTGLPPKLVENESLGPNYLASKLSFSIMPWMPYYAETGCSLP